MEMNKKNKISSNSQVFGRWPHTKILKFCGEGRGQLSRAGTNTLDFDLLCAASKPIWAAWINILWSKEIRQTQLEIACLKFMLALSTMDPCETAVGKTFKIQNGFPQKSQYSRLLLGVFLEGRLFVFIGGQIRWVRRSNATFQILYPLLKSL